MALDKISTNIGNVNGSANSSKDASAPAQTNARDPGAQARDPKMLEAARSFENQFIRQMISEMRKTVPKEDDIVGNSMADDIYREQLDDQYADSWTDQGGIGLADLIYGQLYEKYGPQAKNPVAGKAPGEFLKVSAGARSGSSAKTRNPVDVQSAAIPDSMHATQIEKPKDILSSADKNLFLMKMGPNGFTLKSKEPLPEQVGLRAPLSGVVMQAARLDDGRQMVVLRHDQGLVTRFVHTGVNRVKNDMRVVAGEIIADLPASQKGEPANVVFELRQASKPE